MEVFQKLIKFIVDIVNMLKDLVYSVSNGKAGKPMETAPEAEDGEND